MSNNVKKTGALCMALTIVLASTLFALGSIVSVYAKPSTAAGISSLTSVWTPGSDPWGTAFDSSGRVGVALPGCDLSPSCPSSTPPGKLALFDPPTQSWVQVVSLPAGFGQPIFVAVSATGKVWFKIPGTNTIGEYDLLGTTV